MMKKKLLMLVCGLILVLGGLKLSEEVFGIDILPDMPAITPRQKQLKYLKDHEQDIIDFVKSQKPKIESVQIRWDNVKFGESGWFTPEGGIYVYGGFNHIEDSGWTITFIIKNEQIAIDSMVLSQPLRVGGDLYE